MAPLENPGIVLASEIIGEDGTVFGKYYKADRSYTDYDAISKHVINALLATEDRHFYDHTGISGNAMLGVFIYPLIGKWRHGDVTITQQLARRLLTDNGARQGANVLNRIFFNIEESLLIIKLERNFSKQEIMALYLNTACFGGRINGIENATRVFFNKDAGHLSLAEAAVLVGMLKGLKLYNPYRNPQIALSRRNVVIDLLRGYDFITQAEAEEAADTPILLRHGKLEYNKRFSLYFRDELRGALEAWCKSHKTAAGVPYNLYQDGLKVYTTFSKATTPGDARSNPIYITCIKDKYGSILQTFAKGKND